MSLKSYEKIPWNWITQKKVAHPFPGRHKKEMYPSMESIQFNLWQSSNKSKSLRKGLRTQANKGNSLFVKSLSQTDLLKINKNLYFMYFLIRENKDFSYNAMKMKICLYSVCEHGKSVIERLLSSIPWTNRNQIFWTGIWWMSSSNTKMK